MLLGGAESGGPALSLALAPPPGFSRCTKLHWVALCENPHPRRSRASPAQKAGLAYEKKAVSYLKQLFPNLIVGQWFKFSDGRENRFCQTDAVNLDGDAATIFEIKIRWTATAWWQLRELYSPVVRAAYQPKRIHLVCVTRAFDPAIPIPETINFVDDLRDLPPGVNVHLWRP